MNSIGFYAALILNRLRNEAALRPEQNLDEQAQEHGDRSGEQRHEDQRYPVTELERKALARQDGGCRVPRGSYRTAMTALGRKS